VYLDTIVITGDDTKGIDSLKKYLQKYFQTKNPGSMKYFLGIKMARFKKGILLSQRKCILDLHSKAVMLGCMSIGSPIDVNAKLLPTQEEFLGDVGRYKGLVEKLNYRTVITDITSQSI